MPPIPVGKLRTSFLDDLLKKLGTPENLIEKGVILGSSIGEDAAILDTGNPSTYLVAKTDPITFATGEIGHYVVNVNANDIATRGATPRWFLSTILLPQALTEPEIVEDIFVQIKRACDALGAVVIGGHTEVTHGLNRPIVVGSMLGDVPREKVVKTSGAQVGDALVLTKGVVIEGVSVIAHEKEDDLIREGFSREQIDRAKNFLHDPGLSVVKEALIGAQNFEVHAMHDPTEGGLAMSLYEIARAAGTGIEVNLDDVRVLPEAQVLCDLFDLDPFQTLTSGTLLLAMPEGEVTSYIDRVGREGIFAQAIGTVVDPSKGLNEIRNGTKRPLQYSEIDEITKIF